MKRFPVMLSQVQRMLLGWVPLPEGSVRGCFVCWELVAPHEIQAKLNHGQTLEQLANRGGLSPQELWCVVHDKRWPGRWSEKDCTEWLSSVMWTEAKVGGKWS